MTLHLTHFLNYFAGSVSFFIIWAEKRNDVIFVYLEVECHLLKIGYKLITMSNFAIYLRSIIVLV